MGFGERRISRLSLLAYFTKRGERIWAEPRGQKAGYHWPQISIHRGLLQMLLLDAAIARLGPEAIHFGHPVTSAQTLADRVEIAFGPGRDGSECPSVSGRALIAADGIHSAIRHQHYPDEGLPRWNGAVMWRGVADAPGYLDGHTMIMAGHRDLKFVCYPIDHRGHGAGNHRINFVAERRAQRTELAERADWTQKAPVSDFLPLFEAWNFGWLDVPAMIRSVDDVWVYPMVDRDPLPRWTFGRVTLLGDAAHPMYPIGSNGASQAVADARVLAGCLVEYGDDVNAALARYESIRRPATAAIVKANRSMGPELPMQLVEERAPNGFARLQDVISEEELATIAERYKKVAGFAIEELNERPSLVDPRAWNDD